MSHRRRGVGVNRGGAATQRLAQKKADEIKAVSLQSALDTIEKLEVKLTDFAKQHQSEFQNDPVFRARFLELCAPMGIDPLASKKTVWGRLLGMGDFYHELAVKVAEVCLASRSRNGGIMSLTEIQQTLAKRKTRLGMTSANALSQQEQNISVSDISIAVSKLSQLGGGFRTVQVGNSTMVISVPTELDSDHMQVMALAAAHDDSGITIYTLCQATGWTNERATRAMDLLSQQGMAWLDSYRGEDCYWFPSVWQEAKQEQ